MALAVKNLPASAGDIRDVGSSPWVTKISWKRAWQPTPVFLLGEPHGQRSLAGYRVAESNTTEATWHIHTHSTQAPSPRKGRALGG